MKTFSMKIDPLTGEEYYEVYLRGHQLLADPLLNKAAAFTHEERGLLELEGLIRSGVSPIEEQVERTLGHYRRKPDDLERYVFLMGLLDRSEPLFYRFLREHMEELIPIVYTPTVGQACLQLSHIMRRYRGVFITPDNINNIDSIFQSLSLPQVYLIVATDGERILGLGDLGSDGMGIPVGKVNLYVAAGGLHPACCLPVTIDVGTNNQRLLDDPLYLGWHHPRLEGRQYDEILERFVLAVRRNFPDALLQWEDFAKHKAFNLLERYRDRILSFNDDIQGTGATALGALLTAMRIKRSRFADERFVIVGMGQAGTGIAANIMTALKEEGLSEEEGRRRIFAFDMPGLLVDDLPNLDAPQRRFTQRREWLAGWQLGDPNRISLFDAVKNAQATVLIGVTAERGLFNHEILTQMGQNTPVPMIMALSNPTSRSECTPDELARATDGRGLMATGSPFPPLEWNGRTTAVSQCNNLYIFPGVGLGALVAKATKVTDAMFLAASKALSALVPADDMARGYTLPRLQDIRRVAARVAFAVAKEARDSGLGRLVDDDELVKIIRKAQWEPRYTPFRPGLRP